MYIYIYSAIKIMPKNGFRSGPLTINQNPEYKKLHFVFFFPISNSLRFQYIVQLKYCQNQGTLIISNKKHLGWPALKIIK